MTNELMVIPQELEAMAVSLPNEKKLEIVSAVKNVFENVQKMRVQLEAINVADENDKVSMKLANTVRMAIRTERLAAEKFIDSKRETVQMLMSDFKTEDALWLKTKQLMQIETKSVEDLAKYKETTGERIMAERKATLEAQRQLEVSKYTEYPAAQLSDMEMQVYEAYLQGLKVAYEARIEAERQAEIARIEAEVKEQLKKDRKEMLLSYWDFVDQFHKNDLSALNPFEFSELLNSAKSLKEAHETQQAKIKADLEKAKQDAERKEKEFEAERKKQADILAEQQAEAKRIQAENDAENARLQAELNAKKDAEIASEKVKQDAEIKAKAEAEKAAKAPIKQKLSVWVESFSIAEFEQNATADDIKLKFESFKKWAKSEIDKL